jgi:hypothetical protein
MKLSEIVYHEMTRLPKSFQPACVAERPTLRARIRDLIATVTPNMLNKTWQKLNTDLPQMCHMFTFTELYQPLLSLKHE